MNGLMSDGGPAFPGPSPSTGIGLTVREYIAAHIMGHASIAFCMACASQDDRRADARLVARAAVELTDALMVELRNS
jgi:hypothetical protein